MVLDEGRVSQRGTHRQLLAAEGLYRRMWLATHRDAGAAAGRATAGPIALGGGAMGGGALGEAAAANGAAGGAESPGRA